MKKTKKRVTKVLPQLPDTYTPTLEEIEYHKYCQSVVLIDEDGNEITAIAESDDEGFEDEE